LPDWIEDDIKLFCIKSYSAIVKALPLESTFNNNNAGGMNGRYVNGNYSWSSDINNIRVMTFPVTPGKLLRIRINNSIIDSENTNTYLPWVFTKTSDAVTPQNVCSGYGETPVSLNSACNIDVCAVVPVDATYIYITTSQTSLPVLSDIVNISVIVSDFDEEVIAGSKNLVSSGSINNAIQKNVIPIEYFSNGKLNDSGKINERYVTENYEWGSKSNISVVFIPIPQSLIGTYIKISINNSVIDSGSALKYLPWVFTTNNDPTSSSNTISGCGESPVNMNEAHFINTIVKIPNNAAYLYISSSNMRSVPLPDSSLLILKFKNNDADDVPTENSDNLVKSGGVYNAISVVNTGLQNILEQLPSVKLSLSTGMNSRYVTGGYGWGTITNDVAVTFVPVVPGTYVKVTINNLIFDSENTNTYLPWVFTTNNDPTSSNNTISGCGEYPVRLNESHSEDVFVKVPSSAAYIYLTTHFTSYPLPDSTAKVLQYYNMSIIDNVPTENSNNLVKSGGVYSAISSLNVIGKLIIPISGKVSIIGDSISTFAGTMPSGYLAFYPKQYYNVLSVNDMYWHYILDATESTLEINASWSGSTVQTVENDYRIDFYSRTTAGLLGNPDYIMIELGTNDPDTNMGDYDYDTPIADLPTNQFIPAYIKGLKSLMQNYPNAKIILLIFYMGDTKANAIKNIGEHYNLDVIDVRAYLNDYSDAHPNNKKMLEVARIMTKYYILNP